MSVQPFGRPSIEDGYFAIDGRLFWPIGFNYWPASSGVACWSAFDQSEWDADFRQIASLGYNTVRLFALWPIFQPREDAVDQTMLRRLGLVVDTAAAYGLWAMPTIFQGWMSGTNYDPPWRNGRSPIGDASMRNAMCRLAAGVGAELAERENVLAIDLANEIDAICWTGFTSQDIGLWTAELSHAIRQERPHTLVTNGTADTPIHAGTPWRLDAERGIDFHNMHGYPVFWTPLPVDRLDHPRTSSIFGWMTAAAAAFGPVMRQEFGTAMGGDGPIIANFVELSAAASLAGGANGFLYWCWSDFITVELPYDRQPFESSLGYRKADGSIKTWGSGYDRVRNLLDSLCDLRPRRAQAQIYWPDNLKTLENGAEASLAAAWEHLLRLGITAGMTREMNPADLLILPESRLTIREIHQLGRFLDAGGTAIVVGVGFELPSVHWSDLTGCVCVNFDAQRRMEWESDDTSLPRLTLETGGRLLPIFDPPPSADQVIRAADGTPLIVVTEHGEYGGRLVQCVPNLAMADDLSDAVPAWWRRLLDASACGFDLRCDQPWVQLTAMHHPEQPDVVSAVLAINHTHDTLRTKIELSGSASCEVDLPPRSFKLFECDVAGQIVADGDLLEDACKRRPPTPIEPGSCPISTP